MVREARPEDKEPVLEFTKNTWERGDYIHFVWDRWLNDPHGLLLVADIGGDPIGLLHVRFMPDNSAWLEGLRVHPNYRRRGIATKLNIETIKICKEKGVNTFRGAIFEWNNPSIMLATRKLGFKLLEPMWVVERWKITNLYSYQKCDLKPLTVEEFLERIELSSIWAGAKGLIFYGWAWFKASKQSINRLLEWDEGVRLFSCDGGTFMARPRTEPRPTIEINAFSDSNKLPNVVGYIVAERIFPQLNRDEFHLMISYPEGAEVNLSGIGEKESSEKLYIFEGVF